MAKKRTKQQEEFIEEKKAEKKHAKQSVQEPEERTRPTRRIQTVGGIAVREKKAASLTSILHRHTSARHGGGIRANREG